ncbi:transposase [Mesorhizobium sp. M0113]
MHAPEVVCISKTKKSAPYEFGCKVGIATTNPEGLVLAANSFEGNPYDGHTLAATVDQAAQIRGAEPDLISVDKGYRGHDYAGSGPVRRQQTWADRHHEAGVEATIGHRGHHRPHEDRRRQTASCFSGMLTTPSMRCSWPPATICASSSPHWRFGLRSSCWLSLLPPPNGKLPPVAAELPPQWVSHRADQITNSAPS